jgi:hypothetical protein
MRAVATHALGLLLAALVLAPREARAMGAVVGAADQPVSMAWARVAVAVANGRTARWAQISTGPATSAFAWLIPIEPGARVDLTTDAWLDALDAATVPVVLPPAFSPSCDVALAPDVTTSILTPSTESPGQASIAFDLSTLTSFITASGFEIGSDLATSLGKVFSAGEGILSLVYGAGALPVRTIRIVDTGPATLPLELTGNASGPTPVSVFTIAGGEEEAGSIPLVLPGGSLSWLSSGQSNYAEDVASLLTTSGGSSWLNQSAGPSVFFRSTVITPSLAVPSVLEDYYALASKYGDTMADPDACTMAAVATMESSSTFAEACPLGALAVAPGPTPCASSPPSDTPIDGLLCGAVADAAIAVGTLRPDAVWVTRTTGIVTVASAANVPLLNDGTTPESPVLVASSYPVGCGAYAPDGGWDFVDGGGDDGGGDDGGGDDGGGDFGGDGGIGSGDGGAWGLGDGDGSILGALGDATSSAADSCDSSSDGDTTGGCSGDSSSSDDDSSGCSGGSSSASDSGGCSGNNDCMTAKHGHRTKSPMSRAVILLAAALGIARRRRRPRARPESGGAS